MAKKKLTLEDLLVPKDEIPYEVPENWCWIRFEHLIKDTKLGLVRSVKQQFVDYSYNYLKMNNITNSGDIDLNNMVNVEADEKEVDIYSLKKGDFLFNTRNSRELVGKNTVVVQDFKEVMLYNNNIMRIRFHEGINPQIVSSYLNSPMGQRKLDEIKKVTTNVAAIYAKDLNKILIPIPPLAEQERIVKRVESIFEKVDKAKELVEDARDGFEKRRAAIFEKAFCGELTKKWRKENGVNREWDNTNLGNIIKEGPQNGLYKPRSAYGDGNLIVRIDNFYDGSVNPWDTLKRLKLTDKEIDLYSLDNGDFIVNRVNSIDYLGKSALVRELKEISVFESNVMRFKVNEDIDKEYLIKYMSSPAGLRELRKNAKHAVNQASINQQDVKGVMIPLPSLDEQREIVKILDKVMNSDKEAYSLSRMDFNIEIIKKSILAKAFRGELGSNKLDESSIELI